MTFIKIYSLLILKSVCYTMLLDLFFNNRFGKVVVTTYLSFDKQSKLTTKKTAGMRQCV